MKHDIGALFLSVAFATLSHAKIATFTYSGVVTEKGGFKCSGGIGYTVNDDAGAAPFMGQWNIDDCIGDGATLDDGTFSLAIDANAYTAVLKEISTGLELHGTEGEHRGEESICTNPNGGCPIATTLTCYFGAGPEGTDPTTTTCDLSG